MIVSIARSATGRWCGDRSSMIRGGFAIRIKLPQSAYYRPLQDVWLWLNYHMFGFAPAGWHLTMIAVHLIAVWLVFRIARELTDSRWTPIIAATLFGVLPIHAQAVVWPTAIPLPMSAVFMLAAFLCFIRSERDTRARKISRADVLCDGAAQPRIGGDVPAYRYGVRGSPRALNDGEVDVARARCARSHSGGAVLHRAGHLPRDSIPRCSASSAASTSPAR